MPTLGRVIAGAMILGLAGCGRDGDQGAAAAPGGGTGTGSYGGAEGRRSADQRTSAADGEATAGPMVEIPAGNVVIDGKTVSVDKFEIDVHEVTNDEFAAFIAATGFETEAERIGNSVMFFYERGQGGQQPFDVVTGATWDHPRGPASDLSGIGDHPVVHVSWNDAVKYAKWAGKRLPTRAEWVYAASGGLDEPVFPWGDELRPQFEHMMNAWQGVFPAEDQALDGYRGTSPVGSFPPNGLGVFDMAGNVWEWTGSTMTVGDGPEDQLAEKRGGSFLCREKASPGFHACRGYRVSSFEWSPVINGNDNVGFRCAR